MKQLVYLLITIILLFLPTSTVNAQVSEQINSFNDYITVEQNGNIDVVETIEYNFGDNYHHGIFRTIPLSSKVGNLYRNIYISIQSVTQDGHPENYTTSFSFGNPEQETIKIGDPNLTINGVHSYAITYQVKNAIGNYSDHDELYWNVTGNDWSIPIQSTSITVTPNFATSITKSTCYTGLKGSTDKNCTASKINSIQTTSPLGPNEGLSAVFAFPPQTFPPSTLSQTPLSLPLDPKLLPFVISALIVLGILYFLALPFFLMLWYFKHKHKNHFGPVSVNFDFPEDAQGHRLPPAEAGTVDATKLDQNDVVATIFDLAIRKHLKITETGVDKKFLGISTSSKSYAFQKLNKDTSELTDYEKKLYDWIFSYGNSVDLNLLKSDFYITFADMDNLVFDSLVDRGLFTKNPNIQRGALIALSVLSLVTLNILLAATLFYLSRVLNGRTQQGDLVDWKLDGLKLFLKNMSREYKWQANELIIVEKMIPYAMALGYIDKFMDQLKLSYPDYNPYWYSGNSSFFYTRVALFSALNSNFITHPQASASSSGFSVGGFSGGGGGGGGGGSW